MNKKTILSKDIEHASFILKKGGILVFPTETVWGIGADSRNWQSCKKIYQIKNRPLDNPFIVHLENFEILKQIAEFPIKFTDLFEKFSPGPITYILKLIDKTIFSTGLDTIAVRVPSHPTFLNLLKLSKIPISAPSANFSGKPSITRFQDALETFDGIVDFILEGEDSFHGVESTVLSLLEEEIEILRPGIITQIEIETLGYKVLESQSLEEKPKSPGMKYRHYAPEAEVQFVKENLVNKSEFGFIGFTKKEDAKISILVKDNIEYMKKLYSFFNECDRLKLKSIFCDYPKNDKYKKVLLNRIEKAILK